MQDGIPYGPIQGQGQGHVMLKVRNSSICKIYLVRHFPWELANRLLILKLEDNIKICSGQIFDVCPGFCVT